MVVIAIPVLVLGVHGRRPSLRGRAHAPTRPGRRLRRRARPGGAVRQRARRRDGRGAALRPRDRRRPLPGDPRRPRPASAASRRPGADSPASGPPLLTLPRERTVSGTVARHVRELEHAPGEVTTLVVPELFKRARWSPSCAAARRSRCGCACRAKRTSCWPTCRWWPMRTACAGRSPAGSRRRPSCCRSPSSTPPRATPSATRSGSARATSSPCTSSWAPTTSRRRARPGRRARSRSRSRSCRRPTATSGSRC